MPTCSATAARGGGVVAGEQVRRAGRASRSRAMAAVGASRATVSCDGERRLGGAVPADVDRGAGAGCRACSELAGHALEEDGLADGDLGVLDRARSRPRRGWPGSRGRRGSSSPRSVGRRRRRPAADRVLAAVPRRRAAAAQRRRPRSACRAAATLDAGAAAPVVTVPVLSSTTVSTRRVDSSTCGPLIRMPSWAPRPVPTSSAVGVASPRAHGQAMISTATAAVNAAAASCAGQQPDDEGQRRATPRTTGTKTAGDPVGQPLHRRPCRSGRCSTRRGDPGERGVGADPAWPRRRAGRRR